MISVFLNLLRLVLWIIMWSVLENVSCLLEKNVFSAAVGWSILYISISNIWFKAWFKSCISLLVFCLDDLSVVDGKILKTSTIALLYISSFRCDNICLICLGTLMLGVYIFLIAISSWWIDPLLNMTVFAYCYCFWFKAYFVWYKYSYPSSLWVSTCMEYLFLPHHFEPTWVIKAKVNLLQAAYYWVLVCFSYPSSHSMYEGQVASSFEFSWRRGNVVSFSLIC